MNIAEKIAQELQVKLAQVSAAIQLLDEGSTVPFISRYRKEVTGGLTDTQLRQLDERLNYLRELADRRQTILQSIKDQEKLTPELETAILAADNKATLEDLYLPYKPKRRTKAQIAKEAGLEPLAFGLLENAQQKPEELALSFMNAEHGIETVEQALEGARQILMEHFAEQASLLGILREYLWQNAIMTSKISKGKEVEAQKFADYFEYQEPIAKIPSHRALALFRGQRESFLLINITLENAEEFASQQICHTFEISKNGAAAVWLLETVRMAWLIKIFTKLEIDLLTRLRENAEIEAIKVFTDNVKQLLMAAPAGSRVTMGLDPGLRTGVKLVVIDSTGKLLVHTTIFPHAPRNDWEQSIEVIAKNCKQFQVELVSIGNGTASRETDKLISDVIKKHPELNLTKVVVSEAGASVYSASEFAAKEFPDLDVSYRGAVSIARRLQDPLAELIKIDPKSIGVGQYQHDVNQTKLGKSLQAVLEDCVNAVGVDLNTASIPLLASVSGLSDSIAKQIVEFRDKNGSFQSREALKEVPRLGPKTFEQAAGFLRIVNGSNPLDCSAVHPEAYPVVEKILYQQQKTIREIMGNSEIIRQIKANDFTDEHFGLPTVIDLLKELEKPGRDPRPEFKTATFAEGIEKLADLKPGMILEGTVTNVANFGAFVDIGVHQDGLVHISELADHFVKDPKEVVKIGDIVKVRVVEVDIARKRITLSMKTSVTPKAVDVSARPLAEAPARNQRSSAATKAAAPVTSASRPKNTAMADALKGLIK